MRRIISRIAVSRPPGVSIWITTRSRSFRPAASIARTTCRLAMESITPFNSITATGARVFAQTALAGKISMSSSGKARRRIVNIGDTV